MSQSPSHVVGTQVLDPYLAFIAYCIYHPELLLFSRILACIPRLWLRGYVFWVSEFLQIIFRGTYMRVYLEASKNPCPLAQAYLSLFLSGAYLSPRPFRPNIKFWDIISPLESPTTPTNSITIGPAQNAILTS